MENYVRTKKDWIETIKNNLDYFINEERNPFIESQNVSYFNRVWKQIEELNANDNDLIEISYVDENNVNVRLVK